MKGKGNCDSIRASNILFYFMRLLVRLCDLLVANYLGHTDLYTEQFLDVIKLISYTNKIKAFCIKRKPNKYCVQL